MFIFYDVYSSLMISFSFLKAAEVAELDEGIPAGPKHAATSRHVLIPAWFRVLHIHLKGFMFRHNASGLVCRNGRSSNAGSYTPSAFIIEQSEFYTIPVPQILFVYLNAVRLLCSALNSTWVVLSQIAHCLRWPDDRTVPILRCASQARWDAKCPGNKH